MNAMRRVLATREGLSGHTTASGHIIQELDWFVALPSTKALGMIVQLAPEGSVPGAFSLDCQLTAPVWDVGPFNEHDDAYVFGNARPQAELGISVSGKGTNKAGIDLSDCLWRALGFAMTDGPKWIYWAFFDLDDLRVR